MLDVGDFGQTRAHHRSPSPATADSSAANLDQVKDVGTEDQSAEKRARGTANVNRNHHHGP